MAADEITARQLIGLFNNTESAERLVVDALYSGDLIPKSPSNTELLLKTTMRRIDVECWRIRSGIIQTHDAPVTQWIENKRGA